MTVSRFLNDGDIAFLGTVEELSAKTGSRYIIDIKTGEGDQRFEADDIGETMLTLLEDFKRRGIEISDIKIDRGTLEQHFIDLSGEEWGMSAFLYGLALQWKLDMRSRTLLITCYVVPLLFFAVMGGIFTSITPIPGTR